MMRLKCNGLFYFWKSSTFVLLLFALSFGIQTFQVNASSYPGKKRIFDPLIIKFCVNQLLYEDTFANGNPSGDRTVIDPTSAAKACKPFASSGMTLPPLANICRCSNALFIIRITPLYLPLLPLIILQYRGLNIAGTVKR